MNLGKPLIDIKFTDSFWKSLQPVSSSIMNSISSLIHYRVLLSINFIDEAILDNTK